MKKIEVCLDAGHGIETPGKRSPDGKLREAVYCRDLVRRIANGLAEHNIATYIVTPEDRDISLTTRANRVNSRVKSNKQNGIDTILISIHCNACGNGKAWMTGHGWECWTTRGKTISDKLSKCMYDAAKEMLPIYDIRIRDPKENDWTILKKSACACVLTENLFMDNKDDYDFMMSEHGKCILANVHIKGIMNYISS